MKQFLWSVDIMIRTATGAEGTHTFVVDQPDCHAAVAQALADAVREDALAHRRGALVLADRTPVALPWYPLNSLA